MAHLTPTKTSSTPSFIGLLSRLEIGYQSITCFCQSISLVKIWTLLWPIIPMARSSSTSRLLINYYAPSINWCINNQMSQSSLKTSICSINNINQVFTRLMNQLSQTLLFMQQSHMCDSSPSRLRLQLITLPSPKLKWVPAHSWVSSLNGFSSKESLAWNKLPTPKHQTSCWLSSPKHSECRTLEHYAWWALYTQCSRNTVLE